ncbi:MAG: HAMP domain-containing histidine kinase [Candidatus Omnitrophica bacterium]|nr:HAMP domain-containing histidine kinase [Candidatus Omnitrophota bacterium]
MKIKKKTYALIVLISVLFCGLYFFVLAQTQGLDGKITKAMIANRMRELVLDTQRGEEDFLRTGNREKIKDISSNLREIILVAKKAEPTFKQAMPREAMNQITKLVRDYETVFKEILGLKQEIAHTEKKLNRQGIALEEAVAQALVEIKSGKTAPAGETLDTRVDKITLANKILKEGYGATVPRVPSQRKPIGKIQTAIDEIMQQWEGSLIEPASAYAATFQEDLQLQLKMESRVDELHKIAQHLEEVASKTLVEMNAKRDEAKSAMMNAILAAFAICGILMLSLSFWFMGILTGPILRLRRAMLEIARGNLNAALDVHSDDEIGELAESFRTMGRKLKDSTERLKRLDELKSRFISAASHELKTPLTSLKGYVEIVLKEEAGSINTEQKEYLGYVKDSADRLHRLVRELLNISRIESGEARIAHVETDLSRVVKEEAALFKRSAAQKGIEVSTDIHPNLKPLYCDSDKIREALDNLISNAVKATPPKGKIRVFARANDQEVQLGVEDNGIGIRKEDQERIFDPFHHIDVEGRKEDQDSTGLGLTLVKRIVEAHGGRIHVQSEKNQGATFIMTFPWNTEQGKLNDLIGRGL